MRKLLYFFLLVTLLTACSPKVITEYIEVPKVSIVEKHDTVTDSVYEHDSIIVYQRGDTIFRDLIKYKYKDKVLIKNHNTTDTVTKVQKVPVEVPVEVEKKLTKLEKTEIFLGKALILLLALAGVGGLVYLFIKRKL